MTSVIDSGLRHDPSALTLVYKPEGVLPYLDIVLVHGLGRTSTTTWTQGGQNPPFRPDWLQGGGPLCMARVWMAGYNTSDLQQNLLPRPRATIDRFVKRVWDVIGRRADGSSDLQIPVVFVAHSTGGIIVKQAYFFEIDNNMRSTCAMLFLATPHKRAAIKPSLTWGVEEGRWQPDDNLDRAAETLDQINGWFSQADGDGLLVASFVEQPPPGEDAIVDSESSRLDFPGEIVQDIRGRHSSISQCLEQGAPGFAKVVKELRQISRRVGPFKRRVWNLSLKEKKDLIRGLCGNRGAPFDDLAFFRPSCSDSCTWIQSEAQYDEWLRDLAPRPRILCLTGSSGSGKAALGSYMIEHFEKLGLWCQFYFFRYDDQSKRSVTLLFKSLALQMADRSELFRDHLTALAAGGYDLEHDSTASIWGKVFAGGLSSMQTDSQTPLYWIIVGTDDCDSLDSLLHGLVHPSLSTVPLRILLTCQTVPALLNVQQSNVPVTSLDVEDGDAKRAAMRPVIQRRFDGFDPVLLDQVIQHAGGNFITVDKVVQDIRLHGKDLLALAPPGLREHTASQYWEGIASDISARRMTLGRSNDLRLALTLVLYAIRPLTSEQVRTAMSCLGGMVVDDSDLLQLCGAFCCLDVDSHLVIKHRTAWQFLTGSQDHGLCHSPADGHRMLARLAFTVLSEGAAGNLHIQSQLEPWCEYAIISWGHHLRQSLPRRESDLPILVEKFLGGPAVVWWIYMLGKQDRLSMLVEISTILRALYSDEGSNSESTANTLDGLIISWATELVHIHDKFGNHLCRDPLAIYEVVPAFCPRSSLVRRRLEAEGRATRIIVEGVSDEAWDDTLARIPVQKPSKVISSNQHIVVSSVGSNQVKVISATTPCNWRMLGHNGIVHCMRFSNSGHMLALASVHAIAVWQVDVWFRRWTFDAPPSLPTLDMIFDQNDVAVLVCFKDGSVRRFPLDDFAAGSSRLGHVLATDSGASHRGPSVAAFCQDASLLAVAYPGLAVSVWRVDTKQPQEPLRRLYSAHEGDALGQASEPVRQVAWTSFPYHVLVIRGHSAYIWDPARRHSRLIISGWPTSLLSSPNREFILTTFSDGSFVTSKSTNLSDYTISPRYESLIACSVCPHGKTVYKLSATSCDILSLNTAKNRLLNDLERDPTFYERSSPLYVISSHHKVPLEMLAVSPRGNLYVTAHSGGKLRICTSSGTELLVMDSSFSKTIEKAAWSSNGDILAFTDDLHRLHIHNASLQSIEKPAIHRKRCAVVLVL